VGDYGVTVHVSESEAVQAIRVATDFLDAVEPLLRAAPSQS